MLGLIKYLIYFNNETKLKTHLNYYYVKLSQVMLCWVGLLINQLDNSYKLIVCLAL